MQTETVLEVGLYPKPTGDLDVDMNSYFTLRSDSHRALRILYQWTCATSSFKEKTSLKSSS